MRQCLPDLTVWKATQAEAGGSARRRLHLGVRTIVHLRAVRDDLLRLWPIFGTREATLAPLWRHHDRDWWQVIHDPVPLSAEPSTDRWLTMWAALSRRDPRCHYVVHSPHAADLLRSGGVEASKVRLLPHPVLTDQVSIPTVGATPSDKVVLCLGRAKGARDIELMRRLPSLLGDDFSYRVMGLGWPSLPGWEQHDRHLEEREFDQALTSAAVVLVPYEWFFQSNVMVRALEQGTPCVAPRNPFSEALVGPECTDLLVDSTEPEAWSAAIRQALNAGDRWRARLPVYQRTTADAYQQWWADAT
jgi:glycosyltransferase involved in cell wall biosynthesis